MGEMTYSEARNFLEAIKRLEALEAKGDLRPAEAKLLAEARNKAPKAQGIIDSKNKIEQALQAEMDTTSRYRGMQNPFGFTDELVGLFGGAEARDRYRAKDDLAKQFSLDNFNQGKGVMQNATTGILGGLGAGYNLLRTPSMIKQIMAGAGLGSASTALPQFAEGTDGFVNRVQNVDPFQTAVGGGIGSVAPVAGQFAGNTFRAFQNLRRGVPGYEGPASMKAANAIQNTEQLGTDVKEYLANLGPEGMLADTPGSLRALSQGLAVRPGEGQTKMVTALADRAEGTGARIEDDVTRLIDEPNAAITQRQAERELRSGVLGPLYETAKASKLKFNAAPLSAVINAEKEDASQKVKKLLKKVQANLGKPPYSAKALHQTRSNLSNLLFSEKLRGDGGAQAALKPVLNKMDEMLDTIPGYATAREGWSDSKSIDRALDAGFDILDGGKRTTDPTELRQIYNEMTDAQKDAFQKGIRARVRNMMGTARNDALGANPLLTGFNKEKLEIVLGKSDANELIKRLNSEKAFAKTKEMVVDNSQTAQRAAADRELGGLSETAQENRPGILTRTKQFLIDNPSNRVVDSIIYGSKNTQRRLLAELLTLQGPQRDIAVDQLINQARKLNDPSRLQMLINVLTTSGVMSQAPQNQ